MTNQTAIIVGALIVGAAILAAQFLGRYEIAVGSNAENAPVVWHINAVTGRIEICSFSPTDEPFEKIARNGKTTFVLKCDSSLGAISQQ